MPPPKPSESTLKVFTLGCTRCKSERVCAVVEPDEENGTVAVYLFCRSCSAREPMPVRVGW